MNLLNSEAGTRWGNFSYNDLSTRSVTRGSGNVFALDAAKTEAFMRCSLNGTRSGRTCTCIAGYNGSFCQYSSTTCNGGGTIDMSGACMCDVGKVGANCCDLGYTGNNCADCIASTHQRYNGSTSCVAQAGVSECPSGQHSVVNGSCARCDAGSYSTYPTGRGYSLDCTRCPDGQLSPVGSSSVSACFFQFQTHAAAAGTDGICTGIGSDARGSTLSLILSQEDCITFAESSDEYTFAASNPTCVDSADCSALSSVQCGTSFGSTDVSSRCRVLCNACGRPQTPCILEPDGATIRYFDPAATAPALYLGATYTPVCTAFLCPRDGFVVDSAATANTPPRCVIGNAAVQQLAVDEDRAQSTFFAVVGVTLPVVAGVGYGFVRHHKSELTSGDHQWIWFGLTFTIFDMVFDWATYYINIGEPGAENSFYYVYGVQQGGDVAAVRDSALAFCILGTILTPIDVYAAYHRMTRTANVWLVFSSTLAISLLEDLPQLSINILYVNAVGWGVNPASTAVAVVSLLLSITMLMYNAWMAFKDWSMGDERYEHGRPTSEIFAVIPAIPTFGIGFGTRKCGWKGRGGCEGDAAPDSKFCEAHTCPSCASNFNAGKHAQDAVCADCRHTELANPAFSPRSAMASTSTVATDLRRRQSVGGLALAAFAGRRPCLGPGSALTTSVESAAQTASLAVEPSATSASRLLLTQTSTQRTYKVERAARLALTFKRC